MGEDPNQLSLSWDHFGKNLQDTWRHLHQSEEFADVTLACDLGQVTPSFEFVWTSLLPGDGAQDSSRFLLSLPSLDPRQTETFPTTASHFSLDYQHSQPEQAVDVHVSWRGGRRGESTRVFSPGRDSPKGEGSGCG